MPKVREVVRLLERDGWRTAGVWFVRAEAIACSSTLTSRE